jgi:putative FmdB family regulatory protein
MPIYAYKCSACGHSADVLQKMSDVPRTTCPACGAETYAKQLTAPGFALKGSGWYVTDFRDNKASGSKTDSTAKAEPADATTKTAPVTSAPASAPANSAPATAPAAAAASAD